MVKKIRNQIILVVLISILLFSPPATNLHAEDKIFEEDRPNVIFMVGDGMGIQQVRAASLVEYGGENLTIMDTSFDVYDTYTTLTIDDEITDSGAGGTALATGQKTEYSYVSLDPDNSYYMKTILEYLEGDFGYASGLVSTTHIGHATPAAFSAHSEDRDYYDIIYPQIMGKGIEVLLGGGLEFQQFSEDGARSARGQYGFDLAFDRDTLLELTPTTNKILGVFGNEEGETHLPYEDSRNITLDPSLLEMTSSAIEILDRQDEPFFLMVEGGKIDRAGHLSGYNNETTSDKTIKMILQTIMFEKSIRAAYEYAVQDGNTIVVVCADHETGGFKVLGAENLSNELPSESNSFEENLRIRSERSLQLNSSWKWTGHTNDPVPFYGYGGDFGDAPVDDNIDVFFAVNHALGSFPIPTSYRYTPIDDQLEVRMHVIDFDQSVSSFEIVTLHENGTVERVETNVSMNSTEFDILENVTLPIGDYEVYVQIKDGNQLSVNSFSNKNGFIRQNVDYQLPQPSTSETVTSSTSELTSTSISTTTTPTSMPMSNDATTEDTPSLLVFTLVTILISIISLRKKKRMGSLY